ncbi:hypothetical protein CQW23_35733 [Capsicum baccatum]|uniref:Uncharacterized protein n=1 Tax=Capsicum baccatum TaxID=33114 RepID=A0A2G2UUZ1_CAPBA|nr:hypothetical protein CQW23_35733 [Capsicum baccatum]
MNKQKWLTPPPYRKNKSSASKENAPPLTSSDLNCSPDVAVTGTATTKMIMKSPLPPRHPNSNPLKSKLSINDIR